MNLLWGIKVLTIFGRTKVNPSQPKSPDWMLRSYTHRHLTPTLVGYTLDFLPTPLRRPTED